MKGGPPFNLVASFGVQNSEAFLADSGRDVVVIGKVSLGTAMKTIELLALLAAECTTEIWNRG